MYDVITMGSATVDIFGTIGKKLSQPKPGDKVLIEDLKFEVGGGGVNSAIAFSRMGLKAAFLGKVGHDHNGVKVIKELKEEKVPFIHMVPSKKPTSYSFILMSNKQKDRIIYTYKGASDDLDRKEINFNKLKETRWIYMATLLNRSLDTAKKVADFAKNNRIDLMFNPSSYLAQKGKKELKKILDAAKVIVFNKSEARALLNTRKSRIDYLLKEVKKTGPDIVIITQGSKGAHAYDGENIIKVPAAKVDKVVSTAGAGDAFASGFLAGMIRGEDLETSLKIGAANSASVIKYYGTQNRLLSYSEAKDMLKKSNKYT